jgi:hypothetical protein
VLRRELDAVRRHQVGEWVVRPWKMRVHRLQYGRGVVRAGHRQHRRVRRPDDAVLRAQAAGDDHAAVLLQRLADRAERLFDRRVDEAAGVDDDEVGAAVA